MSITRVMGTVPQTGSRDIRVKMLSLLIICSTLGQVLSSGGSEKELIQHLLSDYEPSARPVKDPSHVVNVTVELHLISLYDLNERNQVLTIYAWLGMEWEDEYLQWNPDDWNGIQSVVLPTKRIWLPDLVIRNSAVSVRGGILDEDQYFRCSVFSNGHIVFFTAGDITSSCAVDMTYFPFDDQACFIHIDSWTYAANTVLLVNESNSIYQDNYRTNGQWSIMKTEVVYAAPEYEVGGQLFSYTSLKFVLYLRRKPLYYVYNIVVPSIILSMLVLLVFLLPADAGEKMSLGITVLLAFSVFQLIIADSMPETSDIQPIISIYIIGTMVVSGISLVCTVIILSLHHHNPDKRIPPPLRRVALFMARISCMRTSLKHVPLKDAVVPITDNIKSSAWNTNPDLEKRDNQNLEKRKTAVTDSAMQGILTNLEYFRHLRELDDATEERKAEWIEVARIMDRTLLLFFLIFTIVSCVIEFGIYPLTKPAFPTVIGLIENF